MTRTELLKRCPSIAAASGVVFLVAACGSRQGGPTEPSGAAGPTAGLAEEGRPVLTEVTPEVMGRIARSELPLEDLVDPDRGVAFIWGGSVTSPEEDAPPYELGAHEELVVEGIVRGSVRACGAELATELASARRQVEALAAGQSATEAFTCEGEVCTIPRTTEWNSSMTFTFRRRPAGGLVLDMVDSMDSGMLDEGVASQLEAWAAAERTRLSGLSCAE